MATLFERLAAEEAGMDPASLGDPAEVVRTCPTSLLPDLAEQRPDLVDAIVSLRKGDLTS